MSRIAGAEATRAAILDAAAALLGSSGSQLPTIVEVAREAELSRPTVYAYFDSREAIFHAVARRVREEVLAGQQDVDASSREATIRAALLNALDVHIRHVGFLTTIAKQAHVDEEMAAVWKEILGLPNRRYVTFIDQLVAEGRAHPAISSEMVAEAIGGVILRFAVLAAQGARTREELGEELIAVHNRLLGFVESGLDD